MMLIHSKGGRSTAGLGPTRIVIPVSGTIAWCELDVGWYTPDPSAVGTLTGFGVLALTSAPEYGANTTGVGQDSNVLIGLKIRQHQATASASYQSRQTVVIPDMRFKVFKGQDLWNVAYCSTSDIQIDTDLMFLII